MIEFIANKIRNTAATVSIPKFYAVNATIAMGCKAQKETV